MSPLEPRPIHVVLVEDDASIRESLMILINGASGFRGLAAYASAEAALTGIPLTRPDVVLMDIQLPHLSGIECVRQLRRTLPDVQIIMLTVFEDDELVFEALSAGATGYVLKRTSPAELLEAIAEVHRGGSPMSSQIARKVVQSFRSTRGDASALPPMTPREAEILGLLSKGFRYKEIADALAISMDTVRSHIRRLYDKLHVSSRTEAVVRFLHS